MITPAGFGVLLTVLLVVTLASFYRLITTWESRAVGWYLLLVSGFILPCALYIFLAFTVGRGLSS